MEILVFVKSMDGGTGTYVLNLLQLYRVDKTISVRILCLEKPRYRKIDSHIPVLFHHNRGFYRERFNLSIHNLLTYLDDFHWFKKHIDADKSSIVLGVDLYCNIIACITRASDKSMRLVLTEHIDVFSNLKIRASRLLRFCLRFCIRYLYPRADKVVLVSKGLRTHFLQTVNISEKQTAVVYNGVELHNSIKRKATKKHKIIVTIARIVNQKDHKTLLSAFQIVRKSMPDAKLWILSDGYMKQRLMQSS